MQLFIPRFLQVESGYLILANILLGMIVMVVLHCFVTGLRSRDVNYLSLAVFFSGALINAISNLYLQFIIPTIEPYIGSWLMLFSFLLFVEHYLRLPPSRFRGAIFRGLYVVTGLFFILSIVHHLRNPNLYNTLIMAMDILSALLILGLLGFLIVQFLRGNRRAGALLVFEAIMVAGAISAMGVFKTAVEKLDIIPLPLLQGNFLFLIGMVVNGFLFSHILSLEMTNLKVRHALAEVKARDLEELDRTKSDFIMNISHELRTPLAVIDGVVRQLKQGRWGDSLRANKGLLETISRNNLKLFKQVTNLLELSRMEQHRYRYAPVSLDISRVVSSLAGEFRSLAEQRGIEIHVFQPPECMLTADPFLLETAVMNLLSNALKFTPSDGSVTLSVEKEKQHTMIRVADTGPGVPLEERDNIFNRFYQAPRTGGYPYRGTGIGLAMVREIMEQHKGRVYLEQPAEGGSVFVLQFPRAAGAGVDRASARSADVSSMLVSGYKAELAIAEGPQDTPAAEGDASGNTVLLVEDDPDLAGYLQSELAAQFRLLYAENGKEALRLLQDETPELIVSDVMMPVMDGHRLFEILRADKDRAAIPFLFLTARDSFEEKLGSLEAGAVDYIEKPFAADELIAKIGAIINTNAAVRDRFHRDFKDSLIEFIETFPEEKKEQNTVTFEQLCRRAGLTDRERDIAGLIRRGRSDKEIAAELNLSVKTVSNYNTSIFRKMEVSGRVELAALDRG